MSLQEATAATAAVFFFLGLVFSFLIDADIAGARDHKHLLMVLAVASFGLCVLLTLFTIWSHVIY